MTARTAVTVALLAAIGTGAFLLRHEGVSFGLPAQVHPDEKVIADPARRMASGGTLHPGTFLYPSFYIYAEAATFRLHCLLRGGPCSNDTPETEFFPAGRTLTILAAAVAVLATFAAGAELYGPVAGLVAAPLAGHASPPVAVPRWNRRRGDDGGMPGRGPTSGAPDYRRTKPTMSLTAFIVSSAITCARCEPSARIESM